MREMRWKALFWSIPVSYTHLLYAHDNQYGLSIDSVLNEGTRITVRLPVKECGEVSVS